MDTNPNAPKIKFKSKKFAGTETDMAAEALAVKAAKEARAASKAKKPAKKSAKVEAPKPEIAAPSEASVAKKAAKKADISPATKYETRAANMPEPTVKLAGNAAPGVEIANELQTAFQWLNYRLFDGKVEPCVIVVSKLKRSYGHFWHSAFARRSDLKNKVHEIGIDFRRLSIEGADKDIDVLSTIAHEMAHAMVYQLDKADAAKNGTEFKPKTYHCKTWAAVMNRIGLKPVALDKTGQPNGKETGPHATHEIVKGGKFKVAAEALLAEGFKLNWSVSDGFYDDNGRPMKIKIGKGGKIEVVEGEGDGEGKPKKKKAGAKAVHVCPHCQSKAWGKPSMVLMCSGTKDEPHDRTEMDCDRSAYEADEGGEGEAD